MKFLPSPYNPELLTMLNDFSDWFMEQPNLGDLPFGGEEDPSGYYTSEKYLEEMQSKDPKKDKSAEGFPNHTYGIDLMRQNYQLPEHMQKPCSDIHKKLNSWFGSKFCAVFMYYPPSAFMDWHNNCNCPGYNTLISYSYDGDGYFMWQDPKTKAFHKMHDLPGWQVKVGYFGSHEEPDKTIWHCAKTNTHRLTFGYVIPDKNMWEMMIEDITDA